MLSRRGGGIWRTASDFRRPVSGLPDVPQRFANGCGVMRITWLSGPARLASADLLRFPSSRHLVERHLLSCLFNAAYRSILRPPAFGGFVKAQNKVESLAAKNIEEATKPHEKKLHMSQHRRLWRPTQFRSRRCSNNSSCKLDLATDCIMDLGMHEPLQRCTELLRINSHSNSAGSRFEGWLLLRS